MIYGARAGRVFAAVRPASVRSRSFRWRPCVHLPLESRAKPSPPGSVNRKRDEFRRALCKARQSDAVKSSGRWGLNPRERTLHSQGPRLLARVVAPPDQNTRKARPESVRSPPVGPPPGAFARQFMQVSSAPEALDWGRAEWRGHRPRRRSVGRLAAVAPSYCLLPSPVRHGTVNRVPRTVPL